MQLKNNDMQTDKMKSASSIEMNIVLKLTEKEARFLALMTKWGSKLYIDWFKKHCSNYDLRGLEESVESLFTTINTELPKHIEALDAARQLLADRKK